VAVTDTRSTVGLDVGGTKIEAVLLDGAGAVRARHRRPTTGGPDAVTQGAAAAVRELLAEAGTDVASVAAVGLAVAGVVDTADGTVRTAVNLGIDAPVALGPGVSGLLGGVDVVVENDLNAAVLGARHLLAADGGPQVDDLAFLALGTGLAAGLLLDGRLRRGAHQGAGEIGHLTLIPGGLPCNCGQRGCLERYGSGSALDAAWPSRTGRPSPVEVFEAAAAGDTEAIAVRDTFVHAVAAAVRVLVLTCDIGTVVIGGGVSLLGEPLHEAVTAELRRQSERSAFLAVSRIADRVRMAPVGVPVGAVGAALLGRRGSRPEEGC
jgi:predicted NBD/HSP70 family sugar kinase